MSLLWVIIGSLAQLGLGGYMVLASIFAGGAIAQHHLLTELDAKILNASFFVLPLSFVASAIVVLYCYFKGAGNASFWWYVAPWAIVFLYVFYCVFCLTPES